MDAITLSARVTEDHRLIVDLPPEIPAGPVELVVRPLDVKPAGAPAAQRSGLTREQARARLLAAGALSTAWHAPRGTVPLSQEEMDRIGRLLAGSRLSSELIDEDRGTY